LEEHVPLKRSHIAPMPPTQTELASLAFVSYLHRLGMAQSHLPSPMQAVALLMFHDAVELFLRLACDRFNVGRADSQFMDYFTLLQQKLKQDLQHKESMRRLNKARVGLKHHGNLPAESTIENFRIVSKEFFEDNCPPLFGIGFSEISLTDYVADPEARQHLKEAEQLLLAGHSLPEAALKVRKAFTVILDRFEKASSGRLLQGRPPYWPIRGWIRNRDERVVDEFARRTIENVKELQDVVRLTVLGIDYRRYIEFRRHVPTEYGTMMNMPSPNGVQYSIEFVIDVALHLQTLPP
jgi:hypothetical protein